MTMRVECASASPQTRRRETLATAADRVAAGVPLRDAVADFLVDLRGARDPADVDARIVGEPSGVDPHADAYFAALAEHVASAHGLRRSGWATAKSRFLDHFWWPSRTKALRARAIVESPAAFRRRGIFIGGTTLQRV
jgi:hypothetical protein